MLAEAKDLLKQTYLSAWNKLADFPDLQSYAEEKYVHSLQVLGAGNYILQHEDFFIKQTSDFIELARTVLVLHDIARFEEAILKSQNIKKYDHSVEGANILKNHEVFGNILITLPIKHHGHMIEDFYDDEDFKTIYDNKQKEDIKNLIFLVRDADKIANFAQLCNPVFKKWHYLFFSKEEALGEITPIIRDIFLKEQVTPRQYIQTKVDRILNLLSWFYDLNYQSSFTFCRKLNIDHKMINIFKSSMRDNIDKEVLQKISMYIEQKIPFTVK